MLTRPRGWSRGPEQRCSRCGRTKRRHNTVTRHHLYPKRYWWPEKIAEIVVPLCQRCHRVLEGLIELCERSASPLYRRRRLPPGFYVDAYEAFRWGDLTEQEIKSLLSSRQRERRGLPKRCARISRRAAEALSRMQHYGGYFTAEMITPVEIISGRGVVRYQRAA